MQNPVYRPNQTSSRGKQSLQEMPDIWELGSDEQKGPRKISDGPLKETKVDVRPMNDTDTISNFDYQVDIIVPFHGQYEKVTRLVESIYQCTRSNYYTLTLVDDASPNLAFITKVAKTSKKLKAIRLRDQRGFAGAAKVAFDRTESPYVCIVNSDCVVKDLGWLRTMGESLLRLRNEGVKMVSPKTNNPTVMGCDSKFEAQYGEKPQHGVVNIANDIVLDGDNHLSMYCIMCHRDLFKKIGFLREYPYGYYEDEEFAHRMRSRGYKQAVCCSSWIYHEGGCTIKYLWRKNPQIRLVMEQENRERCIKDMSGT